MTPRKSLWTPISAQGLRWRRREPHFLRGAMLLVALAGCARYRYVYGPPQQAPASHVGWPTNRHALLRGEVETSSFGVVELRADEASAASPALHVRIVLRNRDDGKPWRLDTRKQMAYVPGAGTSAPMLINAEALEVAVARGESRAVDLYYPVARGFERADDLPGFELDWQLAAGDDPISGRSAFVRMVVEPQSAIVWEIPFGLAPGWAPYWWHEPLAPAATFVHPLLMVWPRSPRRVIVGAPDALYRAP